jgi:hypothetical protein
MTLVLDRTSPANALPSPPRLSRAIRAWGAFLHRYRFFQRSEPSDPFASMSSRDRWDLPVWHPSELEG